MKKLWCLGLNHPKQAAPKPTDVALGGILNLRWAGLSE